MGWHSRSLVSRRQALRLAALGGASIVASAVPWLGCRRRQRRLELGASAMPIYPVSDDVLDVRLTRWGHPLPLAEVGLVADGHCEAARRPIAGRVFFAHQDNWCSPAFEPSFATANEVTGQLAQVLRAG